MEGGVPVIRARPWRMRLRVRAHDMVIREHVAEPEFLDPFGVGTHRTCVRADLGLGEHDADAHGASYTSRENRATAWPRSSSTAGLARRATARVRPPSTPGRPPPAPFPPRRQARP